MARLWRNPPRVEAWLEAMARRFPLQGWKAG